MKQLLLIFTIVCGLAGMASTDAFAQDTAAKAAQEAFDLMTSDPEAAARRAREARDLLGPDASAESRAEIDLLIVLADFYRDPGNAAAGDLRDTLEDRDENNIVDTGLSMRACFILASYSLRSGDWNGLIGDGQRAERAIQATEPENIDVRALAIGYQGVGQLQAAAVERQLLLRETRPSRLADAARYDTRDMQSAVETFERGIALFPRQESMADFNSELAKLIAWRAAGIAVLRSMDNRDAEKFLAEDGRVEIPWPLADAGGASCALDWSEQPDPDYPDRARMRGYVGGAVVVFDVDRSGRVQNARILAEVPSEQFGAAILKVMPQWRADVPADMPDACLADKVMTYEFYFSRGGLDQPRKPQAAR